MAKEAYPCTGNDKNEEGHVFRMVDSVTQKTVGFATPLEITAEIESGEGPITMSYLPCPGCYLKSFGLETFEQLKELLRDDSEGIGLYQKFLEEHGEKN